jgi:hypothetical protein
MDNLALDYVVIALYFATLVIALIVSDVVVPSSGGVRPPLAL